MARGRDWARIRRSRSFGQRLKHWLGLSLEKLREVTFKRILPQVVEEEKEGERECEGNVVEEDGEEEIAQLAVEEGVVEEDVEGERDDDREGGEDERAQGREIEDWK